MNETKILAHGDKYVHASIGSLHGFEGKQFGEAVPFFHSHKANEENYIILSGAGRFQVDNEVFDIAEGSVIRVATNCDRNLKCTSAEPLTYICIQATEGSLGGYTMTDAEINERENLL